MKNGPKSSAITNGAPYSALNYEDIKRTAEDIQRMMGKGMWNGLDVIVVPDSVEHRPNMQLSPGMHEVLSPAMVEETNSWMVEFFGTTTIHHSTIADGQAIIHQSQRKVYMNPRTFEQFKKAVLK